MNSIIRPSLILNERICKENISNQIEKARKENVEFRPHFKTHQSHEIGRWYRELGVNKITVSSLKMAEYFARDDWKDITVAFPVNTLEHELINNLAKSIKLNLLIADLNSIDLLAKKLKHKVNLYIEIDTGQNRTGFSSENKALITSCIQQISQCKKFVFKGFLSHAGHSYKINSTKEEIQKIHDVSVRKMIECKHYFSELNNEIVLSIGDTPTFSVAKGFAEIDEVRPGNAVFYDLTQHYIGACSKSEIGVQLACPIVAINSEREEFTIYGGAVHFSKDSLCFDEQGVCFGELASVNGEVNDCAFKLIKLSQEHGTVKVNRSFLKKIKIGDIAYFYPVHSCLTANIMPHYITQEGTIIEKFSYSS